MRILSKIANWRLPPGFFREGFFLGVTLVGCGVKLVFWIAREACGSKRPVFDIPRSGISKTWDLGISVKSLYLPGPVSQSGSFQATRSTQCFAALIPKQASSQSYATTLSCNAFTNNHFSHGTIWILEQNLSKNDDPEALTSRHFRCGKAVANASTAESRELVLSFFPKVGKFYQFWIHIARSQLRVHSIELHLVGLGMEPMKPMKPMKPSDHARLQSEVRRLLPRSTDIFAISGVGHYCSAQAAPKICVALLERPSTS
ncbi:unnamed protein product [Cylindrotheca closterium]|uniref:Uncharacterized protein n=1 Tax=Cylindrotheca closterium TaxID=2856 RepID=A0AAD2G3G2_9STRA|nr:unnamed protein product [Cylindrotheca closterium]